MVEEEMTPEERVLVAIFFDSFNADAVDIGSWIVMATDPVLVEENRLTFWGPFTEEIDALTAIDTLKKDFSDPDLSDITFRHAPVIRWEKK